MRDRFNEVQNFIHLFHAAFGRRTILQVSCNDSDLAAGKIRYVDGGNKIGAAAAANLAYDCSPKSRLAPFRFQASIFPYFFSPLYQS